MGSTLSPFPLEFAPTQCLPTSISGLEETLNGDHLLVPTAAVKIFSSIDECVAQYSPSCRHHRKRQKRACYDSLERRWIGDTGCFKVSVMVFGLGGEALRRKNTIVRTECTMGAGFVISQAPGYSFIGGYRRLKPVMALLYSLRPMGTRTHPGPLGSNKAQMFPSLFLIVICWLTQDTLGEKGI